MIHLQTRRGKFLLALARLFRRLGIFTDGDLAYQTLKIQFMERILSARDALERG